MDMSIVEKYDFATVEGRRGFITNEDSGIYSGSNVDGQPVIVIMSKNDGMFVKTQTSERWRQVVEYDCDGSKLGVSFEAVH